MHTHLTPLLAVEENIQLSRRLDMALREMRVSDRTEFFLEVTEEPLYRARHPE